LVFSSAGIHTSDGQRKFAAKLGAFGACFFVWHLSGIVSLGPEHFGGTHYSPSGLHDAELDRLPNQQNGIMDAQRFHDSGSVILNGFLGDA
jgi:hypothetical protein